MSHARGLISTQAEIKLIGRWGQRKGEFSELSPCKTIAAAIQPTLWIKVICTIFLLANNSWNEKDNDLSDWIELFLTLENIENFCLSGISSDDVESHFIVSSPLLSSKTEKSFSHENLKKILSSIPGKDWFDDEFDLEKKLLMVMETLLRPWWGRSRIFCSLWRSVFWSDLFAPNQSLDSGRNAINIISNASFTPITSVKYL